MSAFIRRNGSYREARASQGNLVYNQTEHCGNRVRLSNLVFDGKVYLPANKSSDSFIESNGKHLRDVFSP